MADPIDSAPVSQVVSRAEVQAQLARTRLWWLTAICVVVACGLIVSNFQGQGTSIVVHFEDGHGLKAGDTLHYRGIDVGTVTRVAMAPSLDGIDVQIQLATGNEPLAVEGSQFWIQRARLRLGQVSGLETVVGAKYVGVLPGDPAGKRMLSFQGTEVPLTMTDEEGIEVRIQFPNGEGLEIGDPVRHRGIVVGEVVALQLTEDQTAVDVRVRLGRQARPLAITGTQFWIERPKLDVSEIRGLDTLLGGRYIAVQPGDHQASEAQSEFIGLAEAPPIARRSGALELELEAPDRFGLVRGAPVTYRGLEVGSVSHVQLSSDGASIKVHVMIEGEYAELVRDNSKWWNVQGMQIDVGLQGLQMSVDSLTAWLRGGVAFATPDQAGQRVATGYRFRLASRPRSEWLEWQPQINVGQTIGNNRPPLPKPLRVVATWQSSWLGLFRRQTQASWSLGLSDGSLLVPAGFIKSAQRNDRTVNIEMAGNSFPFAPELVTPMGSMAKIKIPSVIQIDRWELDRLNNAWDERSTLWVVNPELSEPVAIDPIRLTKQSPGIHKIAKTVPLSEELDGSPVIDVVTGNVIGMVTRIDRQWCLVSPD